MAGITLSVYLAQSMILTPQPIHMQTMVLVWVVQAVASQIRVLAKGILSIAGTTVRDNVLHMLPGRLRLLVGLLLAAMAMQKIGGIKHLAIPIVSQNEVMLQSRLRVLGVT